MPSRFFALYPALLLRMLCDYVDTTVVAVVVVIIKVSELSVRALLHSFKTCDRETQTV